MGRFPKLKRLPVAGKVPPPLESTVQKACLQILVTYRVTAWRNNTTGVFDPVQKKFRTFTGRKGVSDILGVIPRGRNRGRFLAIECKQRGKKPSPDQQTFIADVEAAGGVALVIDDPAQLVTALEALLDD